MAMGSRTGAAARIRIFADLDPAQMAVASEGMSVLSVKAGDAVFDQGERAGRFFALAAGRLRVTQVTEQGQQIIVRIVHPGELFGFAPAMDRDTYPGTAVAIVPSRVVAWPRARWEPLLAVAPVLSSAVVRAVGRKLDDAHARMRTMATQAAPQRIASALLRLAEGAGVDLNAAEAEIPFPLGRQDVAELSATTLYTTSRIMARWQVDGVLRPARRRVIIADPAALRAIADAAE